MITIGKTNIILGLGYFLTTLGLGLFLGMQLQNGGAEWSGSVQHHLLKAAHAHGNLESVLNILLGYLICQFGSKTLMLSKIASALLAIGMLFHSGMLYLAGVGVSFATNLMPIGAFSLIIGIALMIPIISKGLIAEE